MIKYLICHLTFVMYQGNVIYKINELSHYLLGCNGYCSVRLKKLGRTALNDIQSLIYSEVGKLLSTL